jgi:hypothetical protein
MCINIYNSGIFPTNLLRGFPSALWINVQTIHGFYYDYIQYHYPQGIIFKEAHAVLMTSLRQSTSKMWVKRPRGLDQLPLRRQFNLVAATEGTFKQPPGLELRFDIVAIICDRYQRHQQNQWQVDTGGAHGHISPNVLLLCYFDKICLILTGDLWRALASLYSEGEAI